MLRHALPLLVGLCPTVGLADDVGSLSINLPLGEDAGVVVQRYRCGDDAPFAVRYVNAEPNQIAILPVDDQPRIFVSVIAASGARYVAGPYEWWTKGQTATLRNELQEGGGAECGAVTPSEFRTGD
ncbi:MliC family protein [Microbaculum marinum]|uniref:MliC family protein n=1 Tax=Microbaculum marinum TaxID=1764581 RepID=A0AAW9RNC8_9HYPH